jgi:GAF domain-containing protein
MSNLQTPMDDQSNSVPENLKRFGQRVIASHPNIRNVKIKKQAELLNTITLIITGLLILGLSSRPNNTTMFDIMLGIAVCSFGLGKSRRPVLGSLLFTFGFISITHLSLYLGMTNSYVLAFSTITPITLIIASALTSTRVFTGLAIYAALGAFLAPLYSTTPVNQSDVTRTGGIVATLGIILIGINAFRERSEDAHVIEIEAKDHELQDLKLELKKQVEANARAVAAANEKMQEKVERLHTVANISQEISSGVLKKTDELLTHITQIISKNFGFYHVGIFLLDKNRQYAELRAANSEGGQRMLARRHQLKVGGTGIVGYASQSGYPRIALSTGADAVYFNNPDLPETRSEMALPLKYGGEVIGVLDLQSTQPATFNEEDADIFSALANQIALAIQSNAGEVDFGLSKKAGKHGTVKIQASAQNGYSYLQDGTITSSHPVTNPSITRALAMGKTMVTNANSKGTSSALTVPVKIRDEIVGYIYIESAEGSRKWAENEIALVESVSERAALALENARLFEETERRAEQELVIAQVTSRIGESTTFERILQTTIQELGRTLGASRAFIQMNAASADEDSIKGT